MTTSAVDREVLRAWRDTHDDVQPDRQGLPCVHSVWIDGRYAGPCGRSSSWIVDYGRRVPRMGKRAHCEAHTVSVLSKWSAFERGEVPA